MKNAITGDTSQTFQRKFQELALAIKVEHRYTKDQILSLYLNDVYFANGVYGIGTAADSHFHELASRLKLAQAAMLVAWSGRRIYDPLAHPRRRASAVTVPSPRELMGAAAEDRQGQVLPRSPPPTPET